LVGFAEGPDSTISVIQRPGITRELYIDGFCASDESIGAGYMDWMGRLPMLLHDQPDDALVICFGTGQTAHAVREEAPARLDIVDLNRAVFDLADEFSANQGVLHDPRVRTITMDGRAWLRRTDRRYDIITLEPMPPTFAGVNALYCREFYDLARKRLKPRGVVAQWLPFHLVDTHQAASIAATFQDVFDDSILWIDPVGKTGILLGREATAGRALGSHWPGYERPRPGRSMDRRRAINAVALDGQALAQFASAGRVITDDNQLLAYSWAIHPALANFNELSELNLSRVRQVAGRVSD
jgi:spermidine synthase